MATDSRNAKCLTGTAESRTFQQFITDCRTNNDLTRANNFFNESKQKYKNLFEHMGAQFDDLIRTGDGLNSMVSLAGATTEGANRQLDQLQKQKDKLLGEITHYRRLGGAADKTFLEDVMHGTPQKETAPSLQDVTLLLFWFGWLVLSVTLVAVRMMSPGGNWKSAAFVLVVLLLVTLCIYGILKQVA